MLKSSQGLNRRYTPRGIRITLPAIQNPLFKGYSEAMKIYVPKSVTTLRAVYEPTK